MQQNNYQMLLVLMEIYFQMHKKILQVAQEQNLSITDLYKKNYIDKTSIYVDRHDDFFYKKGDKLTGILYFRMWNTKKKKTIFDN